MKPPVLRSRLAFPAAVAATLAACALVTLAAGPARAASSHAAASSSATPATDAGTAPVPTQRTRMKTCNAEAHDKHGAERRAFMKQCLSKKGAASAAG